MSQHTDRNRPKRLARRAATVSAGAFVLCLAGASPALADLTPIPEPDLSPVTDTLDPVTDPVTSAVDPVVPVDETVHQVEDELGVSDSTATAPTPPDTTTTDGAGTTTTKHRTPTRDGKADRTRTARGHRLPGPAAVSPAYVPSWHLPAGELPGLRGVTMTQAAESAEPPALAGSPATDHGIISLAGGTLQDLGDPGTPVGRTLLIVVSTLAIGTLAGGHVKAAQDRLAGLA
jgi:hypothetical protein